jgi:hypothetical protein
MKFLLVSLTRIYARLLHLYPGGFKQEFIDEMQNVFESLARDTAEQGILPLLVVFVREIGHLPGSLFMEFWYEGSWKEENRMAIPLLESPKNSSPGSWQAALFASLPHLLIAIFVVIAGSTSNSRLTMVSGSILLFLLTIGLCLTIFFTWRDHWPAWSATWYGYVGLTIFIFAILPPQGWQPPLDKIIGGIGSLILLLLSLVTLVYWLSRRNPVEGLVMALPMMIMYWFPTMEFIPGYIRNWLTAGMFVLGAVTASILIRTNLIRRAIWLVLGSSILIGVPIAYARTYWNNIPVEHASVPSPGQVLGLFSTQFVAGAALAIGPILGWGLWRLGKSYGRTGRIGAGLIITGVLVNLFGQFSYWRAVSHMDYFKALGLSFLYKPDRVSTILMTSVSLLLILTGVLLLVTITWQWRRLFSIVMLLLPFVLPVLAMFPVYFGFHIQVPIIGIEFVNLNAIFNYMLLLAGIVFIFTGGWMVTQLYDQYSAIEGMT